jgi:hypothetical protein
MILIRWCTVHNNMVRWASDTCGDWIPHAYEEYCEVTPAMVLVPTSDMT